MKPLLLIICVLYLPFANAHEYGVFGKTYVIVEQDFLEYIEQKIKAMQASGAWDKAQREFKKRVEAHVMRPDSNLLPRAETERKWLFNPSISAPFDVQDSAGKIIVRKGTVINPLDRVRLSSTLLFFDGDDPEQVKWALEERGLHLKVKFILTSGSVKDVVNHFKEAVYFDLNGFLVKKFQIKALPARVLQKGMRLEVREVAI